MQDQSKPFNRLFFPWLLNLIIDEKHLFLVVEFPTLLCRNRVALNNCADTTMQHMRCGNKVKVVKYPHLSVGRLLSRSKKSSEILSVYCGVAAIENAEELPLTQTVCLYDASSPR